MYRKKLRTVTGGRNTHTRLSFGENNMSKQQQLNEIQIKESSDWMYRPILKTNTRTDYDGNQIEWDDMIDSMEV